MKFGFYSQMVDSPVTRVYADLMEELKEQVVYCEQGGFDIAWADEHHLNFGSVYSPNPIVTGIMLAARIGLPIPLPNWHPLRLAEDVALLVLQRRIARKGNLRGGIERRHELHQS